MCCEDCPKYEKCYENNHLRENCCPKCPEYHDCMGSDEKEDLYEKESDDFGSEDYS